MMRPQKCIAISVWTLFALLMLACGGTVAYAGTMVGAVTHLSGPLLARKADGTVKVLSQKSSVEQGDLLVTEKETYARIKFIDNSEITLRPASQLKIDNFSYEEAKKENDHAVFSLIKGGLRSVTGALGKRSKERFGLHTPTATIGIRGTIFVVEYVPPPQSEISAYGRASVAALSLDSIVPAYTDPFGSRSDTPHDTVQMSGIVPLQLAQAMPGDTPSSISSGRAPGLYVHVLDGMIHLTNNAGTQNFAAGQFGYTPNFQQPPVVLPANPGMQFAPPPSFNTTTAPQAGPAGGGQPNNVDCEVR